MDWKEHKREQGQSKQASSCLLARPPSLPEPLPGSPVQLGEGADGVVFFAGMGDLYCAVKVGGWVDAGAGPCATSVCCSVGVLLCRCCHCRCRCCPLLELLVMPL